MDADIANIVLARIADGSSLRKACAAEGINESTARRYIREDAETATQYARARQSCLETRAEQLMDTASDETIEPASRRIIVDALKWELSKLLPKVYGDKVELEHKGGLTVTLQSGDETL